METYKNNFDDKLNLFLYKVEISNFLREPTELLDKRYL